jgi:hypothetical protein
VTITGGEFQLVSPSNVFGVGPGVPANIVPDSGSTLFFLSLALVLVVAAGKRFARAG